MADIDDLFGSIRTSARQAEVAPAADVRRRGQARARNGRLLAVAAGLVVVAGTGTALLASSGGNDTLQPAPVATDPSSPSASPSPASASPTQGATPTGVPAPVLPSSARPSRSTPPATRTTTAAPTARLSVDLRITSPKGAAAVTYTARVVGLVPQLVSPEDGQLLTGDGLLGTAVDLGDGGTDGSDGGMATCRAGTPLEPESSTLTSVPHTYAPGTYTITFTARACGLTAKDTVTFTVS